MNHTTRAHHTTCRLRPHGCLVHVPRHTVRCLRPGPEYPGPVVVGGRSPSLEP